MNIHPYIGINFRKFYPKGQAMFYSFYTNKKISKLKQIP